MTEMMRPACIMLLDPMAAHSQSQTSPADINRWLIPRKAAVIAGMRGGRLSLGNTCTRHMLTINEFLSWDYQIERHGLLGLMATKIKDYRSQCAAALPGYRPHWWRLLEPACPGVGSKSRGDPIAFKQHTSLCFAVNREQEVSRGLATFMA